MSTPTKDSQQSYYLNAMGIHVWQERTMIASAEDDFEKLKTTVSQCTGCSLHQTRRQTVFGVGSPEADLVIVGEAPGAREDEQGEPFVGRAGQLLNEMLAAIGFTRQDVFICNIIKCRPPKNRDPSPEEIQQCTPFLLKQLKHLSPKLILCLGRISAQYLSQQKESMGKLRGQTFHYGPDKTPVMATYHPAYLLRSPTEKAKAWEDLQRVRNKLHTP